MKLLSKYILPIIGALALGLVFILSRTDFMLYDFLTRVDSRKAEDPRFLILEIDDLSISKVGMFPWDREIMAEGLVLMKEMGAAETIFDIEYSESSPLRIDREAFETELPEAVRREAAAVTENTRALIDAFVSGRIPKDSAEEFISRSAGITEQKFRSIEDLVAEATRDSDLLFARALRLFGNTYLPVNMLPDPDPDISERRKQAAEMKAALSIEGLKLDSGIPAATDIRPPVPRLLEAAADLGFPNVVIDPDGVRRRIELLVRKGSVVFPQLAFSWVLDSLGSPEVRLEKSRIILGDTGKEIPLHNGTMLINWPKGEFDKTFRHLSYFNLVLHDREEELLFENLTALERAGILSALPYGTEILVRYRDAENRLGEALERGDETAFGEYKLLRADIFRDLEELLSARSEAALREKIQAVIENPELSEEYRERYQGVLKDIEQAIPGTRNIYFNLMETRERLREELSGSVCFIGWTGTATTDRGVTVFDETYDNVGTHAAVADTLLSGQFVRHAPDFLSFPLAVLLVVLVLAAVHGTTAPRTLGIGAGIILLGFALLYLMFRFADVYVPAGQALAAAAFSLTCIVAYRFVDEFRQRTFIRKAFGHYLSDDVIDRLIDEPERLALGGEEREMTAIFTDVQGFSTISEQLTARELVHLLNVYLTEMSNIILDLGGTIDKYEGDAIIAFFGAPFELEDHAERACRAAVAIQAAEQRLNTRVLKEGLSPSPLRTRIGINSGTMAVGNMGTERKMDYTIMGNNVNLAARLEGVNKRFGSQILISEATFEAGGKNLVWRRLDRVRVVGINTPVQLYQILPDDTPEELIDSFHDALDIFEQRQWEKAAGAFETILGRFPEDGPAKKYLGRARDFSETPPAEDWDGVFQLTEK